MVSHNQERGAIQRERAGAELGPQIISATEETTTWYGERRGNKHSDLSLPPSDLLVSPMAEPHLKPQSRGAGTPHRVGAILLAQGAGKRRASSISFSFVKLGSRHTCATELLVAMLKCLDKHISLSLNKYLLSVYSCK